MSVGSAATKTHAVSNSHVVATNMGYVCVHEPVLEGRKMLEVAGSQRAAVARAENAGVQAQRRGTSTRDREQRAVRSETARSETAAMRPRRRAFTLRQVRYYLST